MRKKLIAGNWKMHGFLNQITDLVTGIHEGHPSNKVDIVLLPTFVHLSTVQKLISDTHLQLGAQNLYLGTQGAFTGEVSGPMLKELTCQYVLVGHSERRSIFQESLTLVAEKFKAALEAGLTPVLCVGETLDERERGDAEKIIYDQLISVIQFAGIDAFSHAIIAYEPVWAIGTGLTATPIQAQTMHAYIRGVISQLKVDIGQGIRILYGGSVKADNASALFAMQDIDGGLVGGASLDVANFLAIINAAATTN